MNEEVSIWKARINLIPTPTWLQTTLIACYSEKPLTLFLAQPHIILNRFCFSGRVFLLDERCPISFLYPWQRVCKLLICLVGWLRFESVISDCIVQATEITSSEYWFFKRMLYSFMAIHSWQYNNRIKHKLNKEMRVE